MATDEKKTADLGLLEEDDAFEEFPAEGTTILFLRCVTRFFLALGPSID